MRPEVTFNSKYRDFQRQVSFHTITSKPVFLSPLELFSWLTRRNCMSSLPLTPRYHVCTQFARCSSRAQHRPSKNWYFELNVYFRQIQSDHFKKCLYEHNSCERVLRGGCKSEMVAVGCRSFLWAPHAPPRCGIGCTESVNITRQLVDTSTSLGE